MAAVAADYLRWDEVLSFIDRLEEGKRYQTCLIVAFGCYWGLRIGETLSLKWSDVLDRDSFVICVEKSTRKREIDIQPKLKQRIRRIFEKSQIINKDGLIFANPKTGKPYATQSINRLLQRLCKKYELSCKQFSTHSLRKSFGRHYVEMNDYSNESLTLLCEIFQHQRVADTRRYLGITREEIKSIYLSM